MFEVPKKKDSSILSNIQLNFHVQDASFWDVICSKDFVKLLERGVNIHLYLDDWLLSDKTQIQYQKMVEIILQVETETGFQFNLGKSPSVSKSESEMDWKKGESNCSSFQRKSQEMLE